MSVPSALTVTSDVHIFQYSSDLAGASTKLQERLGGSNAKIAKINTTTTPAGVSGYVAGRSIAWLVGHGSSADTKVGTMVSRAKAVEMDNIIAWLSGENFTTIVDTCCEPDLRRKCDMKGLTYYCARDGQVVSQNQAHASLDLWWTHNGMS